MSLTWILPHTHHNPKILILGGGGSLGEISWNGATKDTVYFIIYT